MSAHSHLLSTYKRLNEVRFRLNNLLVGKIPKSTLQDCAASWASSGGGLWFSIPRMRWLSSWIIASTTPTKMGATW